MTLEEFNQQMLPVLFEVMNETGQAGHCILTARVLDHIYSAVGLDSEPLRVDFEVANPPAVEHLNAGGSPDELRGDAFMGRTGTGQSGMYDHHVVTMIRRGSSATLVDPSIIQVTWKIPHVEMDIIILNMPLPLPPSHSIEVNGSRLSYDFHPGELDFVENEQWAGSQTAVTKARDILNRMGLNEAAEKVQEDRAV